MPPSFVLLSSPSHPPTVCFVARSLLRPHSHSLCQLQAFGTRYYEQMPAMGLRSADAAYVLAFSVIMLNTDLHNNQARWLLLLVLLWCVGGKGWNARRGHHAQHRPAQHPGLPHHPVVLGARSPPTPHNHHHHLLPSHLASLQGGPDNRSGCPRKASPLACPPTLVQEEREHAGPAWLALVGSLTDTCALKITHQKSLMNIDSLTKSALRIAKTYARAHTTCLACRIRGR